MNKFFVSLFSLLYMGISFPIDAKAQSRSSLEKERKAIIKKIDQTNKILQLTEKKSDNTIKNIELVNNKIKNQQLLINTFKTSIKLGKEKTQSLKMKQDSLDAVLNKSKASFTSLLQMQFRKKKLENKWLYIFSAESLSDALLRYRYYNQLNEYFVNQVRIIEGIKDDQNNNLNAIKEEISNNSQLLDHQSKISSNLENEKKRKREELKKLKKNKSKLANTLKKAKQKREQLNLAIEKVILANLSNKKNKPSLISGKLDLPKVLEIPLEGGIITSNFGVQNHEEVNGIKIVNNGIDMMSSSSIVVNAVYKGAVIAVVDAQSAGTMVIIQHGKYYTVYTNMEQVSVVKDQEVLTNQSIGKVKKGKTLHFEIWKNKTKMDPSKWLKI